METGHDFFLVYKSLQMGATLKGKDLLPLGTNSFLLGAISVGGGGGGGGGGVAPMRKKN